MESVMLEIMYDIPSDLDVSEVIVNEAVVNGEQKAQVIKNVE